MCSVLEFSSESDKLRTLFSESNHFDSVLFIFDGGRRYKAVSYTHLTLPTTSRV